MPIRAMSRRPRDVRAADQTVVADLQRVDGHLGDVQHRIEHRDPAGRNLFGGNEKHTGRGDHGQPLGAIAVEHVAGRRRAPSPAGSGPR